MKINRDIAEHYIWKHACDGWHFVKNETLSVIAERMPAHTAEDMHYHNKSLQFFYILSGTACMVLNGTEIVLECGEGIEIEPMQQHQIKNNSNSQVEFIVISNPKSHGDKVIV